MNKAVFDGKLKLPKNVIIKNFRDDSAGWCKSTARGREILGINRCLEDRKQFLTVLVHEMVHMYENQFHGKMSHGQTFYAWQGKIKRTVGLSLGEYID